MDMYSRNQYLKKLQEEYLKVSKKQKSKLLSEDEKRTGLVRKYLVRKLSTKTYWCKKQRKKRSEHYDGEVKTALVKLWKIFDYPCGQRLVSLLKVEVDRLRTLGELNISDNTMFKLKHITSSTIDEKLKHEKEVLLLKRKYHKKKHSFLYRKISTKTANEFDKDLFGQIQIDLVEHCGTSTAGEYINSLSVVDIVSGWWEGEAIMGKGQKRTFNAIINTRLRFPLLWIEIHPDNGTEFINWHLYQYAQKEKIKFSRSRPYKKNDNCYVEQKNSTHIRNIVGYLRYNRNTEQTLINDLYRNELRLYKNFFQPIMKLKEKIRIKGKIHRKYDKAKTPYQRLLESKQISEAIKQELQKIYNNLNPAELKRNIDNKLDSLYKVYQAKNNKNNNTNNNDILKVDLLKQLRPTMVTF